MDDNKNGRDTARSTSWATPSAYEKQNETGMILGSLQLCGSAADWLGLWTRDQQDARSNPICCTLQCNRKQVVYTHVPVIKQCNCYQPMGGDALRLER